MESLAELTRHQNALFLMREAEKKRHAAELQRIDGELETIRIGIASRMAGLDVDKIAVAETVIAVHGFDRWDDGDGSQEVRNAINELAERRGAAMTSARYCTKDYDRWQGQGCGLMEYGYGPKHGSIVFSIGRAQANRERDLTEEEIDAAIYYLLNIATVAKARRNAAVGAGA